MTDSELHVLAIGFQLGVLLMLAVHLVGQHLDARRDLRTAQAALARAVKNKAVSGWRDVLTVREHA